MMFFKLILPRKKRLKALKQELDVLRRWAKRTSLKRY